MNLIAAKEKKVTSEVTSPSNIVWLASYPKSGNTWFRSFLTVLLNDAELDINKIGTDGIFSSKSFIENTLDLSADYLNPREIETFQRITFSYMSEKSLKNIYLKIHDAFTFSETDKQPLIPANPTKLAIYLIRNPLDVALSLANHLNTTVDDAIDNYLNNESGAFSKKKNIGLNQFHQLLGTWSMHAESWLTNPTFPVHVIRYEDMKAQPFETFKGAVNAIGLDASDEKIRQAIDATTFEKLKKLEDEKGFKEKMNFSSNFFFKGQAGRWKEELTQHQIEKIRVAHEPMMRKFGYW